MNPDQLFEGLEVFYNHQRLHSPGCGQEFGHVRQAGVRRALRMAAKRMAAKKVIVKRLASIDNLGSMDVFCADKTVSLTEARIHLERHLGPLGKESQRVLELAYFNSFFETGLKSTLDAILEHTEIDASGWRKVDEVQFDFERMAGRRRASRQPHGPRGCARAGGRGFAADGNVPRW